MKRKLQRSRQKAQNLNRTIFWICVALISLFCAGMAMLSALAQSVRNRSPALVTRWTSDPVAPLVLANRDLQKSPGKVLSEGLHKVVREALRREPLNTTALRILAFHAAAAGSSVQASSLASLSERVSRRDLLTQIFLIEQAVQANDHELALKHYHTVLSTKDKGRAILLPVLSGAISNDVIRQALVPYVRGNATWMPEFIDFAIRREGADMKPISQLLIAAGAGGNENLMKGIAPNLLGGLMEQNHPELAEALLKQMPRGKASLLQELSIESSTVDSRFGLLSWVPIDAATRGAAFETLGDDLRVRAYAHLGERGTVLRRYVALPPGSYTLDEQRSVIAAAQGSEVSWELKCNVKGTFSSHWASSSSAIRPRSQSSFQIPASCRVQMIELQVAGGDQEPGLEFTINKLASKARN